MKGAIASVEVFVTGADSPTRRLSLTITRPEPAPEGEGWVCRVALANLHRPRTLEGRDSVEVLARALEQARAWLEDLVGEGLVLTRDREGFVPFERF